MQARCLMISLLFLWTIVFPIHQSLIKGCLSPQAFNKKFSSELKGKSLMSLFGSSKKLLGQGKFGTVKAIAWAGESKTEIEVAVKQVLFTESKPDVKALTTEVAIMNATTDCPTVIKFIGCIEETDLPGKGIHIAVPVPKSKSNSEPKLELKPSFFTNRVFIITEKLYGDFDALTRPKDSKSPFNVFKNLKTLGKLKLYYKIARALERLHVRKIVHSDLKPGNVMATDANLSNIKLIDFGMADYEKEPIRGYSSIYAGIEGFREGSPLTRKFDVFAFAMTVGIMEFGLQTFSDKSKQLYDNEKFDRFVQTNINTLLTKLEESGTYGHESDNRDNFVKIIADCAQFEPDMRIDSSKLVKRLSAIIKQMEDQSGSSKEKQPSKSAGKKVPEVGTKKGEIRPAQKSKPAQHKELIKKNAQPHKGMQGPKGYKKLTESEMNHTSSQEAKLNKELDKEFAALGGPEQYLTDTDLKVTNGPIILGRDKKKPGEEEEESYFVYYLIGGISLGVIAIAAPVLFFVLRKK